MSYSSLQHSTKGTRVAIVRRRAKKRAQRQRRLSAQRAEANAMSDGLTSKGQRLNSTSHFKALRHLNVIGKPRVRS